MLFLAMCFVIVILVSISKLEIIVCLVNSFGKCLALCLQGILLMTYFFKQNPHNSLLCHKDKGNAKPIDFNSYFLSKEKTTKRAKHVLNYPEEETHCYEGELEPGRVYFV